MFHKLIGPLGFGWTTRIIAFVALGELIFSIAVMKMRLPPPTHSRLMFDFTALKELPFLVFCFGLFFVFIGLYFPFFYLPSYFSVSLHSSTNIAFYSIAILNAASVFGRIMPGILADKIGSLNTIVPIGAIATILAFAWIGIKNEAGTIVFACIYGFASGAMVSLSPAIIVHLTPNLGVVGTRLGMCFIFGGLGILIGNPIAGALLNLQTGVFWKAQLFCAIMVAVGTILLAWLRFLKRNQGSGWKI
jgi:MFS family permease